MFERKIMFSDRQRRRPALPNEVRLSLDESRGCGCRPYSINPSPSSSTPNRVSVIEAKISSAKVRHSAENQLS